MPDDDSPPAPGVTLIGGGPVRGADLARALALAPRLVAADSGHDRALALGHRPEMTVGDLDSLDPRHRHDPGVIHDPDQETTDFQKAMARIRAPFVIGLGFLGGRMDHALAVLSALPERVLLLGEADVAFRAPAELRLALAAGTRVSLFPLGPAEGESEGLEWPIAGLRFSPAGRVGTSNRAVGPVRLAIRGPMLVLLPPEALEAALAGISSSAR